MVPQVYGFALDTKVKDQAHKHRAPAAQISDCNTNDVFTSGRQKAPCEYLMEDLLEIFNILKLVHDFINGEYESVQNHWLLLPQMVQQEGFHLDSLSSRSHMFYVHTKC